jgi:hypothetical protein
VYLSHIPAILAREAMMQAVIASMPHMEEESRMEVLNEWARAAGAAPVENSEKISMDEFKSEIKQRII